MAEAVQGPTKGAAGRGDALNTSRGRNGLVLAVGRVENLGGRDCRTAEAGVAAKTGSGILRAATRTGIGLAILSREGTVGAASQASVRTRVCCSVGTETGRLV